MDDEKLLPAGRLFLLLTRAYGTISPDLQVVLVNTGKADKTLDRKVRVRAVWYVLLAALEDVETQRRGFCFLVTLKTARITQVSISTRQ